MNILIADDQRETREIVREFVRSMEMFEIVDEAKNGEEAWAKLTAGELRYKLVVCSFRMAKLDGLSLLKKCKATRQFRSLPFLMTSGEVDAAMVAATVGEWGAVDFIVKPFSAELFQKRLRNILNRLNDPTESMFYKVEELRESGNIQEAIDLATQAETEARISLARLINIKGECLLELGEMEQAAFEFERACSISPVFIAAYKNLSEANKRLGNIGKSIDALKHINEICYDIDREFELCTLLFQEGNDKEGLERINQAINKSNKQMSVLKKASHLLVECGMYEEAEFIYDIMIKYGADAATYNNLGVLFRQQGKYSEAEKCYNMAIEKFPNNATIHYNLGILYMKAGEPFKARKCFLKSIKLDPNFEESKKILKKL
ncbi:MAG: tetratricopeptide repeat protein [Syntrophobacter sp.]